MVIKVVATTGAVDRVNKLRASTKVVIAAPKRGPRGSMCLLNELPRNLNGMGQMDNQPLAAESEATTHSRTKAAVINDAALGENLTMWHVTHPKRNDKGLPKTDEQLQLTCNKPKISHRFASWHTVQGGQTPERS